MKASQWILTLGLGLVFTGCTQDRASTMLEDKEQRALLIHQMLMSHEYTTQLFDSIRTNAHAQMMIETRPLHGKMSGPGSSEMENMVDKAASDSSSCKVMCSVMMKNEKAMAMMKSMMKKDMKKDSSLAKTGHHR